LSSSSGAPTGLSDVRWTRTTVGGPNYLGGSVTLGQCSCAGLGAEVWQLKAKRQGLCAEIRNND
jgi:hypothetical protein